jgi:hypothetical protein
MKRENIAFKDLWNQLTKPLSRVNKLQDRLDNCGEEFLDILEDFMDAGNVWLTTNKKVVSITSLKEDLNYKHYGTN